MNSAFSTALNTSSASQGEQTELPLIIPRDQHNVSRKNMSEEVLKVLYRLKSQGHLAYLCGGGVRDLLLSLQPKDFDVATDADPSRLKKIFHNAWLVGRRFRLAHMVFKGGKIVEVSTFRKKAEDPDTFEDSLMLSSDNTYGTPEEDAYRRDFTINALYYNICDFSIIDYVGGMKDLKSRLIRCIGDPRIRFQEDPVRICRGIRFSVHLGFHIEKHTWSAMLDHGPKIGLCPFPRIHEELLRLMRTGKMAEGFRLYHKAGILQAIFPELVEMIEKEESCQTFWPILENFDRSFQKDGPLNDSVLWASVFMLPVFRSMSDVGAEGDPAQAAYEYLRKKGVKLSIPKAVRSDTLQLLLDVRNMTSLYEEKKSWRRKSRLFAHQNFKAALKMLDVYTRATGRDPSLAERWKREHAHWLRRKSSPHSPRKNKRVTKKSRTSNI